jgi:parallel beta-helix repeat protein
LAKTEAAFAGTAENVTLSGVTITEFANPAGITGAISGRGGRSWTIVGVTSTLNHARGVTLGPRSKILYSTLSNNGQLGIGGTPHNGLIDANEVSDNNQLGFSPEVEAGGIKLGAAVNAHVQGNFVTDNMGSGIWCDESCKGVVIENNYVDHNSTQGIFYEISYDGVIRDNVVTDNGYRKLDQGLYGANILVSSSGSSRNSQAGVVVSANMVAGGTNGIGVIQGDRSKWAAPFGPHIVKDVYVHDNEIRMEEGASGAADGTGTNLFTTRHNRFDYNVYYLGNLEGQYFRWMNGPRDKDEWGAFGQDPHGSFYSSQ